MDYLAYSLTGDYLRCMPERATIPTDIVSVLAFIFGAAVIVPSMISLALSLLAVADAFF